MLASPNHIMRRNCSHGNRATSTLIPSSNQKLLPVRASSRRTAARIVTKASSVVYTSKLDDGLPAWEPALKASAGMELNNVEVPIAYRLASSNGKAAARWVSRFEHCNL